MTATASHQSSAVAFTVIKPYRPAQVIDSERELDFEAYNFIDTGIQFH